MAAGRTKEAKVLAKENQRLNFPEIGLFKYHPIQDPATRRRILDDLARAGVE